MLLERTAVLFFQVDELSSKNSPLKATQFAGVAPHPSLTTTNVWYTEVDANTFKSYGGVPTETLKEEKGPSFPSTIHRHQLGFTKAHIEETVGWRERVLPPAALR